MGVTVVSLTMNLGYGNETKAQQVAHDILCSIEEVQRRRGEREYLDQIQKIKRKYNIS